MARRARRPVEWRGNFINFSSAGSSHDLETAAFLDENYTKPTIVRVRGSILWRANTVSPQPPVGQITLVRAGIICSHDAPDPSSDLEREWLWLDQEILYSQSATTPLWDSDSNTVQWHRRKENVKQWGRMDIDARSMRIVQPGCALRLITSVSKVVDGGQGNPLGYGIIRWLIKE